MTIEEMFQLLMNKIDTNHAEVKTDVARLEANQMRIEVKLDGVIADVKGLKTDVTQIKADVRLLNEHDEVDTFNFNGAYKEIKEVNEKLDKVIADQKIHRRATQANINELQLQVNTLEDKLDKAS